MKSSAATTSSRKRKYGVLGAHPGDLAPLLRSGCIPISTDECQGDSYLREFWQGLDRPEDPFSRTCRDGHNRPSKISGAPDFAERPARAPSKACAGGGRNAAWHPSTARDLNDDACCPGYLLRPKVTAC